MGELLLVVIIIFAIISLFPKHYKPWNKGAMGEGVVRGILGRLPPDSFMTINDVTLRGRNGSSQIDHIVICPFGIIVIETKFYKGWIFGSEEGEDWTQVLYRNKFKFYNPILQNRGHIKALKYHLSKYSNIPFYSIIVMAGSCEFKTFDRVKTPVVYPRNLYKAIIDLSGQHILTAENISNIGYTINGISHNDEQSKEEHIRNAWHKKEVAINAVINDTCPRCGGVLVERRGKYGRFLGCGNYPRCKFTK